MVSCSRWSTCKCFLRAPLRHRGQIQFVLFWPWISSRQTYTPLIAKPRYLLRSFVQKVFFAGNVKPFRNLASVHSLISDLAVITVITDSWPLEDTIFVIRFICAHAVDTFIHPRGTWTYSRKYFLCDIDYSCQLFVYFLLCAYTCMLQKYVAPIMTNIQGDTEVQN